MASAQPLLELDRVSKSFRGLQAVQSVTLRVNAGEILGLIGPNGAGKTTLFNLITGVYRPERGRITFEARDITRAEPHIRSTLGIGRTFQLVRPFLHLTVLENVAVGRAYGREPVPNRRQAEHEAYDLIAQVGLSQRSTELAKNLTLVDRKRLELARALATRPKLLLLDELLAGLNPSEVLTAMTLIQQVRNSGITIIMVEHLVKAVFGISDWILVLNAGELIAEGKPEAVAHDSKVVDAYLGMAHHA